MAKDKVQTVFFDRKTHDFNGLDEEVKKKLREAFKNVDLESELSKMKLWLESPKGTRRVGNLAFIMNWLGSSIGIKPALGDSFWDFTQALPPSLVSLYNDYVKDLWKGREHILEFNTIRR